MYHLPTPKLAPGQPAYHLPTPKLAQRLKVEVAVALMPMPGFVATTRGKADRSVDLHLQDLEAVAPTVNLDEEVPARIPDPEHPVIDHHLRTSLIRLAEADDGVPQSRDVVDAVQYLVLAGLGREHHLANAADLDRGIVVELDGTMDPAI